MAPETAPKRKRSKALWRRRQDLEECLGLGAQLGVTCAPNPASLTHGSGGLRCLSVSPASVMDQLMDASMKFVEDLWLTTIVIKDN